MSTLTLPKSPKSKQNQHRTVASGARARVQAQVRAAQKPAQDATGLNNALRKPYHAKPAYDQVRNSPRGVDDRQGSYNPTQGERSPNYRQTQSRFDSERSTGNRTPYSQDNRSYPSQSMDQSRQDQYAPQDTHSQRYARNRGNSRQTNRQHDQAAYSPMNTTASGLNVAAESNLGGGVDPEQNNGFYGTGMSFAESAQRRVEQKQAKLARQAQSMGDSAHAQRPARAIKPWQGGPAAPDSSPRKAVIQEDVHAPQPFFASCPRGLEWALVKELESLDIIVTQRVASGALIQATWAQIAKANVHSRIASRFLWQLSAQNVRGEDDIYAQVGRIPWEKFFNWRDTIKVDTVGIRAEVRSLEFVTLRVKDAICDRFRAIDGNRPSVDTAQPMMRIMCVLDGLFSQIYLDTTGEPLFKRGWRSGSERKGEAALKENLAAGLLALTEWQADVPLYDPMCGSGTFIIEAAQKAYGIAPGFARARDKHFAMQRFWHVRLPSSDYDTPQPLQEHTPMLFASDIDPEMVAIAAHNVQSAGLEGDAVQLGSMDVLTITPPCETPGLLVLNPPYGERMSFANELDADTFYDAFAANLKRNFKGWSVWLLTSDESVQARMRLKPNATHHVFNGALPCRWLRFDIT